MLCSQSFPLSQQFQFSPIKTQTKFFPNHIFFTPVSPQRVPYFLPVDINYKTPFLVYNNLFQSPIGKIKQNYSVKKNSCSLTKNDRNNSISEMLTTVSSQISLNSINPRKLDDIQVINLEKNIFSQLSPDEPSEFNFKDPEIKSFKETTNDKDSSLTQIIIELVSIVIIKKIVK